MKKMVFIALIVFFTLVNSLLAARFVVLYQNDTVAKVVGTEGNNVVKQAIASVGQNTSGVLTATTAKINDKTNFTLADVAQHTTNTDCWLVINNKVYDVDSYTNKHPGGAQKILDNCGKEVTGIFAAIHSNFAWDLLASYLIGSIGEGITVAAPEQPIPQTIAPTQANPAVPQNQTPTQQPPTSLEEAIQRQFPGATVNKLRMEDDGRTKADLIYNGISYRVVFNADYSIKEIEAKDD